MKNFSKYIRVIKTIFAIISLFITVNSFGQSPTINLTSQIATGSLPVAPTTVEWYADPLLTVPVPNLTTAPVGLYYVVYNYGTCKSKPTQLRFITNICPDTTVNLFNYIDSTLKPVGSIVSINLATPATLSNKITNTQALKVNAKDTFYYYAYYDTTANCFTTTSKIIIKKTICYLIVPKVETGTIPSTGGTAIPNVASNDSVNGKPAVLGPGGNATVSQSGTSWPTGITLDPLTGAIKVASGTVPGKYPVSYTLCDTITPVPHCNTIIDTVTVTPVITPATETGTISTAGGIAIPNVASNDSINGLPATIGTSGNATISQSGSWPTGITLNPSTGAVTVAAGTPSGSYPVVYTICDKLTPPNCKQVNDVVIVLSTGIPPIEVGTIPASGGIAIPNVASNDSINGVPATIGAGGNATIGENGTWPTGITLNPSTGAVTVAKGTPPGKYIIQYNLCDKTAPTPICTIVIDTVIVTPVVNPTTENGTVSSTGGIAIPNVASNDSINGVPATVGAGGNATISQSGTWPTGITLAPSTGAVTVAKGTAPGKYPVTYQICDKSTPTPFCNTVVDTVIVTPVINPATETGTTPATGGIAIPNVASNDSINGVPATIGAGGNATISQSGTWPTGITLDPSTGAVTVAKGTAPGKYPVTYKICDKSSPVPNCTTIVDTVIVTPVVNPATETGTAPATGGIAIPNIASNDSINGVPATIGAGGNATISQNGTWPTGITLDPSTGAVTVAKGTAPGKYPVEYKICDKLTPVPNCTTIIDTIIVTSVNTPASETGTVASTGGIAIPNVASNDSINGVPATIGAGGNATISQSGSWPTGITLDPSTGAVTVAAGTPSGSYPVVYTICDKLTPQNCKQVNDVVIVLPTGLPPIEIGTAPATGGIAIPNVVSNDVINGVPATIGAGGNATISQSGTWPPSITLDPSTGAVTVAKGTAPGKYPVAYKICDKSAIPVCTIVVDTVIVTPVVNPAPENGTVSSTGGIAIPNVASNDSINGVPATIGAGGNATISQSGSWPTGITLDPSTGAVTVAKGTAPGRYPVSYQVCDNSTPTPFCNIVVDTVIVTPVINPATETGTAPSTGGIAIPNVASNDSINGVPATIGAGGNATISQSGTWPTGITLDPSTGAVTVAKGTAPGKYPVEYKICDKSTPVPNCNTIIDTVIVTPVVNPTTENGTVSSTGGIAIPNVASNDSINGVPATVGAGGNATISQSGTWPTGITLAPSTGAVTVAKGTAPGKYPVTYQICDKSTPTPFCNTVVDTVIVTPVINPATETGTTPATGGIAIPNVASNDSINGVPATIGAGGNATISQSGTWPTGITLDPSTGAVTVAKGTAPGKYPVTYKICDKSSPVPNCTTIVDTVIVTPVVNPATETGTAPATGGIAIPNIASNDSINGVPATIGAGGNATISQNGTWPTGITLDPSTGAVTVAKGTAPGKYPVEYKICDKLTPVPNCTTIIDTIIVTSVNTPASETGTVASTGGIAIPNVASNDSINGVPATIGAGGNATISQSGSWPTGITLDPSTGAVTVAAGTPSGSYPVVYTICDKLTPQNCKQVNDVVIVLPTGLPPIEIGTAPATGGIAIPNVVSNDVINGVPATIGAGGNATINQSGTWPPSITLDPSTGAVTVAKGTAPGKYPVAYKICDKSAIPVCTIVVDTVIVTPVVNPAPENGTVSSTGGIAIPNVASNDSINGVPATIGAGGNATISQSGTWPTGITLDPSTGAVTVAKGTAPGRYPVSYQVCDNSTPTPFCNIVVDTVIVTPVINPATETGTAPATGGIAIPNVASNDSINGVPATIGSGGNATISQSGTWPTGITLDPSTGAVTVAKGTAPGKYPVEYKICDKSTPVPNCNTIIDTVIVTPVINPTTENGTAPATGGIAIPNVASNDSINGVPATIGAGGNATISQSGTWPTGITLDPSTGAVTVASGTTPGKYPVTYKICDKSSPISNCNTIIDTVIVAPVLHPDINAGTIGTTIPGNVSTNDNVPAGTTYGTPAVVPGNPSTTVPVMNADGSYTFTPTAPGVYVFNVPVCPPGQTIGCPTEPLVITVTDPTLTNNVPVINNDQATTIAGTPVNIPVLANDQIGNTGGTLGTPTLPSTTSTNGGTLSVNPNGTIKYTPAPGFVGIDSFTYQVCETPSGVCKIATVVVTVLPTNTPNSTSASDDYAATVGTNPVTGNVLTNDVDPQGATQTQTVSSQGSSAAQQSIAGVGTYYINANGTFSFTPAPGFVGTAAIPYTVCDNGTPQACATATLYVVVGSLTVTPIVLTNFTATKISNGASLFWNTSIEINAAHFEIEYSSTGGSNWQTLGNVKAFGVSNSSYNYQHIYSKTGIVLYRLKLVDKDGSYKYSEIRKVNFNEQTNLTIAPNPVSNEMYIYSNKLLKSVEMFNSAGSRVLILSNYNAGKIIDVSNLAKGMYFVKIEDNNGNVEVKKVVKN